MNFSEKIGTVFEVYHVWIISNLNFGILSSTNKRHGVTMTEAAVVDGRTLFS